MLWIHNRSIWWRSLSGLHYGPRVSAPQRYGIVCRVHGAEPPSQPPPTKANEGGVC